MPAAVGEWCSTHDIEKVEKIQQDIINSYELYLSGTQAHTGLAAGELAVFHGNLPVEHGAEEAHGRFGERIFRKISRYLFSISLIYRFTVSVNFGKMRT